MRKYRSREASWKRVDVEDRVVRQREAVQDEHPEDRREAGREDRALERDRDEGDPAVERAASDVERVPENRGPVLEAEAAEAADEAADQDEERDARGCEVDRVDELSRSGRACTRPAS